MLEMSWITAILQLYSQVTYLFGNIIVKCINIRLFDLLALFHYILHLPRNNHVLTEINKAIHVVLIHGYETLRVRFRGRHKL